MIHPLLTLRYAIQQKILLLAENRQHIIELSAEPVVV
jgi:hypothetical protein